MWKLNSILLNNQRVKEKITRESRKYIWLFNNVGFRATTFSAVENPCVTSSWPSLCFFQIRDFTSAGSASRRWCHAVVFTVEKEKNLCVNGPTQFICLLFKGKLYFERNESENTPYLHEGM